MIPVWTLKLGTVAVTLASTAGFWQYVTEHVHPVRAPLKPKVAQPAPDTTRSNTGWDMSGFGPTPAPAATPVVVQKVVVVPAQQQVQSQAALGANWIANRTGQKPVQYTSVS